MMIDQRFRDALAGYHRRKWFPSLYRDTYGEFVDYLTESTLERLFQEYKQRSERHFLDVAYYLYRIIPRIEFPELHRDYTRALSAGLTTAAIKPEHAFYYLRTFSESESRAVWDSLREWCENWETALHDWLHASIGFQHRHAGEEKAIFAAWGWDVEKEIAEIERGLQETRAQFEWELRQRIRFADLRALLQSLRFVVWDNVADWNDLQGIAGSLADNCNLQKMPALRKKDREPAVQFLFPIDPPGRVEVEYGEASGPVDVLRFVHELGKGVFYANMDPDLPFELRIAGDPSLPWFWGLLYCRALADSAGTASIIHAGAEPVSADFLFTLQVWYRYDTMLAKYRRGVNTNLDPARDLYASMFGEFVGVEPAPQLYLYDLDRAVEAFSRAMAHRASSAVVEEMRVRFGKKWFSSERLASRFRDYWRAGYRQTLKEILHDLNVEL